jgi:V/A-type H+-transporting ATPase subunit F
VKIYCIADEDTVRGLRLAGVAGTTVTNPKEAAAALVKVSTQPTCGVIVLTHRVAAEIRPQVEAIRRELERPLIVEIPGPTGPLPGRRSLRQFVQEAVGIRVGEET